MFFSVFTVVVASFAVYGMNNRIISNAFSQDKELRKKTVEQVVSTQHKVIETFAKDYGYWDEMADAVQSSTSALIADNVKGSLKTYHAQGLWVFDSQGKLQYEEFEEQTIPLPEYRAVFASLDVDSQPVGFFERLNGELIEYIASPIIYHVQTEKNASPSGYLLIAKHWNSTHIAELSSLTQASIEKDNNLPSDTKSTYTKTFSNFTGETIASLNFTFPNYSLQMLSHALQFQQFIVILAGLIVSGIVYFWLTRWVVRPLYLLIEKMSGIKDFYASHKRSRETEFGVLERLIDSYLEQNSKLTVLLNEVEEAKLKNEARKTRLQEILNTMPVGVMLVSAKDEQVTFINQLGIDLLGSGVENTSEVVGYYDKLNMETEDGKEYPAQELPTMISLRTGQSVTKKDVFVRNADGSRTALLVVSVPLKDKDGNIHSALSVFQDFTKEHEVDRMKTEFISMASHQLRTPLAAMRWFAELLQGGKAGTLTPQQDELLHNLYESTLRMITLVNTLLNISRLESGRIIVEPEPTDLSALVKPIIKELEPRIENKKIIFKQDVCSDLPKMLLDPKLISEVYSNLLTNAVKYTQEGGTVLLTIKIQGEWIVSKITDSGVGIPKAEQEKVFSKFFRAKNVTKNEPDGTGLGLYLVKLIVESSGGVISFDSSEGKGTTFTFTLPKSGMQAKTGEVTLN